MPWTVEFHEKAKKEFMSTPHSMRAKFLELFEDIKSSGFDFVLQKHVKNIEDGIREFRVKTKDGIARSLYATTRGKRIDILLVFVKKTDETPRRYIDLAKNRRSELQNERNDTFKRSNS